MAIHYSSLDPNRPNWLGGGQWMLRDLKDVTIIFGRNGSGKSLLLRALNETSHPAGTHYASPERAGDFAFDQNIVQQELTPGSRGAGRRGQNLSPNYRKESISRVSALISVLGHAAGHGKAVHREQILQQIVEALAELLPEFRFTITSKPPFYELERISDTDDAATVKISNPSRELSSGEIEVLTVALDLLTICNIWHLEEQNQRLLLLDEPDPHLHLFLSSENASTF